MKINGWTVRENLDTSVFFAGMSETNKPVFMPPCSKTRIYKSERSARAAVGIIRDSGYEGHPEPYYAEELIADEAPPVSADVQEKESAYITVTSEVMRPPQGWRILDFFGKHLALLYNGSHYAIRCKDSSRLFEDSREAAREWCSVRDEIVTARLEKLSGGA